MTENASWIGWAASSWGTSWGVNAVDDPKWDAAQGKSPRLIFHPVRYGATEICPVANRAYVVTVGAQGCGGAATCVAPVSGKGMLRSVSAVAGRSGRALSMAVIARGRIADVGVSAGSCAGVLGALLAMGAKGVGASGSALATCERILGGIHTTVPHCTGIQNPTDEELLSLLVAIRRRRNSYTLSLDASR